MANGNRGESTIEINGRMVTLRPTMEAISNIEFELNRSVLDIVRSNGPAGPDGLPTAFNLKMREVGIILYQAIRVIPENAWADREIILEDVYSHLADRTARAFLFLVMALNVGDDDPALDQLKKK